MTHHRYKKTDKNDIIFEIVVGLVISAIILLIFILPSIYGHHLRQKACEELGYLKYTDSSSIWQDEFIECDNKFILERRCEDTFIYNGNKWGKSYREYICSWKDRK